VIFTGSQMWQSLFPASRKEGAFLTPAKWDPDRFQSAASMSILVMLSYPWQETISFLNINQQWSQATDFTSRSKFGAVRIWPDVLGLGPGLALLRKQLDISSSGKLPSPGAQLLPGPEPPHGSGPSLPKALPLFLFFQKPPLLITAANSIAAVMATRLPCCCYDILCPARAKTQTNWALHIDVLLAWKKKPSNGKSSCECRLNLCPSTCSSDPTITLTHGDNLMFRVQDTEAGSPSSKLPPVLKIKCMALSMLLNSHTSPRWGKTTPSTRHHPPLQGRQCLPLC